MSFPIVYGSFSPLRFLLLGAHPSPKSGSTVIFYFPSLLERVCWSRGEFRVPCYPSPSQLRTEGASMIENIIREVKAEIQRLNQVVRLLEGTKATKQATVTCPPKTSPAEM